MATNSTPPSAATNASSYLDLGITLALNSWPALSLAVQSHWGGPTSSDKRDWLCGALSDMLSERPETDAEDLEDVLIQVMNDEFDVVVDDESAGNVAAEIMEMKMQTARGEFGPIRQMWENYQQKSQQKAAGGGAEMFKKVEAREEDQETDDDEDSDDAEGMDVDMDDAPALVRAPREKVEPEIDEDGFTKVVGKTRR